jgi:hypothetical protein
MFSVIASCVVLVLSVIVDPSFFANIVKPDIQVVLGTLVVAIVLFDNVASGLILGVSVLIMYMRVHAREYGIDLNLWNLVTGKLKYDPKSYPMKSLVKQYITPENLKDAQDNTFDADNYKKEMVGVKGVYGEAVYSAQGTDRMMPGLDLVEVYAPTAEIKFR